MANIATRMCEECTTEFEWVPGTGRPPKRCVECRGKAKPNPHANGNGKRRITPPPPVEECNAHDVIEQFSLDYNLGNAVRFILECRDGDYAENLTAARAYLDRAIARCGA